MIKTIIFDIDETLYSYQACHKVAIQKVDDFCVEWYGWEPGEVTALWKQVYSEVMEFLGFDNACIHDTMIRLQVILEKKGVCPMPVARTLHNLYWDIFMEQMVPFDGVCVFIREAKRRGIRLGLGTDMLAEIQYRKLDQLGLTGAFDFIVTSEEAGYEKPHRGFFDKIMEKAGCAAQECLMIGDNWDKDITGAIQYGMQGAWLRMAGRPEFCDELQEQTLALSYEVIMSKFFKEV